MLLQPQQGPVVRRRLVIAVRIRRFEGLPSMGLHMPVPERKVARTPMQHRRLVAQDPGLGPEFLKIPMQLERAVIQGLRPFLDERE